LTLPIVVVGLVSFNDVVAKLEIDMIGEVVVALLVADLSTDSLELNLSESAEERPRVAEVVEIPLVVELIRVTDPLNPVGVTATLDCVVGVTSVVEGLLRLSKPDCEVSIAEVGEVGDVCVIGVTETEGQTPLSLVGGRYPLEPSADTVLSEEISRLRRSVRSDNVNKHGLIGVLSLSIGDNLFGDESGHVGYGRDLAVDEVGAGGVVVDEELIAAAEHRASDLTVECTPLIDFATKSELEVLKR
jgi:hypothetical protein